MFDANLYLERRCNYVSSHNQTPKSQKPTRILLRLLRRVSLLCLFGLLICVSPAVSHAGTITFNSLEQPGSLLTHIPDPYVEAGFRILDGGELYAAQQSNTLYAGSAGLHERISNGLITLNRVDGNTFRLVSIDLSILHPNGTSPAVTFVGTLLGGGTVTQTFTPTLFGFHTFVFSTSFSNLLSVSWRQGTDEFNAHQFDNIVVDPVPEPAAIMLFGTGLVGTALSLSKRTGNVLKLFKRRAVAGKEL